ncbi:aminotransferase class V-fold PLP-dependent enzyme [Streptomyces sp. NPDC093600]|uniref:aminotransferase class V-fold PLP-dependent enzyme n=1 Tax=Streptomyces sp. NPDC093600 TaxID=3366047 RepID=UPI00381CBF94
MSVDAEQFRSNFPVLERKTYFATCSQGALSDALTGALTEFQSSLVEFGAPWPQWTRRVEEARSRFASLIGARADEIALVSCASEGAYQVVSGIDWSPGDSVVTTLVEFPSIAHVWLAQRARGARVKFAAAPDGFTTVEEYERAIDHTTRLVSVPLIGYRNGHRLPVRQITALARERGAQVFVDAYQGAGVEPIDVRELDCDYLVTGSLKYLLGIPGVAFLYVRKGTRRDLEPQLTGWFGRVDPFCFDPRQLDFAPAARRYETGTPPIPAVYGAVAGMRLLSLVSPHAVASHVSALTGHLQTELTAMGEHIGSPFPADERGPQVALRDDHPDRMASFLSERHIVASPRADVLRLAVHYYTSEADVRALLRGITDYRAQYGLSAARP